MKIFTDFVTALQFLSRIRLWPQKSWAEDSFSRSVKWFPLVGLLIGLGDYLVWYLAAPFFKGTALAAILLLSHFFWAGAICYDGLMDVADGIFSGRPRERVLEIMKDSRTGAFGVLAGATALILRFGFFTELSVAPVFIVGLIFAPVISRWLMILGIILFPYARPEGLGKAFKEHSGTGTLIFGTVLLLFILIGGKLFFGNIVYYLFGAAIVWGLLVANWLTAKLGGLTGDCYGAIAETSELAIFFVMVLLMSLHI